LVWQLVDTVWTRGKEIPMKSSDPGFRIC
jgi:hypothetical protein